MEIKDVLKNFQIKKQKTSERAELIKEIYEIYTSDTQRIHRKKENWKRYIQFLKENRIPDSKQAQSKFKRSKKYIREHNIKSFAYFISIIPTPDLYYILSVAKDMNNRNQNMSAWIISNLVNK